MRVMTEAGLMALAFLASGCAAAPDLVVNVRTDLVPGVEFTEVQVILDDGARSALQMVDFGDDYATGQRAASFDSVSLGDHRLDLTLYTEERAVVLERSVLIEVDSALAVTVVVTRSCVDVQCPGPGDDATANACIGGRCALCDRLTDDACGGQCDNAEACDAANPCAQRACIEGVCFYPPREDACPSGTYCDPEVGCRPVVGGEVDGGVSDVGSDDAGAPASVSVTALFPINGLNFNDHVVRALPLAYRGADTACDAESDSSCANGGLFRVAATELSTCDGVAATDSAGALAWVCDERPEGDVRIVSTGFRRGRGLADLLTSDDFRELTLSVFVDELLVAQSSPARWWTNPVVPLPDNAAGPLLVLDTTDDDAGGPDESFAPGTVFTFDGERSSQGYNLNEERMAIVGLRGARLRLDPAAGVNCHDPTAEPTPANETSLICAGSEDFVWVEGNFDGGTNGTIVVYLTRAKFMRMHRVRVEGGMESAAVEDAQYVLVDEFYATNPRWYGFSFWSTDDSSLIHSAIFNASADGVSSPSVGGEAGYQMVSSESVSVIDFIETGATGHGASNYAGEVLFHHGSITGARDGAGLYAEGPETIAENLTIMGCLGTALEHRENTLEASNLLLAAAALGLDIRASATIGGFLLLGNLTTACSIGVADTGLNPGSGDCNPSAGSGISVTGGVDPRTAIVGRITDGMNPTPVGGDHRVDFDSIVDFQTFENAYRGWGRAQTATLVDPANAGACRDATQCAVYDLRVRTDDSLMRNRHGVYATGEACPASASGSAVLTFAGGPSLRAAYEIVDDGVGDDDGRCESNELCVYNPNVGAYSGEGDLVGPCEFSDGVVSGVGLFARAQNGG